MLRRSAIQPRKRNAPRPAWKVARSFHQWLRGRPCACGGKNEECPNTDIQAAHAPHKASKGMGTKCDDRFAVPLSATCHRLQHNMGWKSFARKYLPSDPISLANDYWKAWPGRIAWERENER